MPSKKKSILQNSVLNRKTTESHLFLEFIGLFLVGKKSLQLVLLDDGSFQFGLKALDLIRNFPDLAFKIFEQGFDLRVFLETSITSRAARLRPKKV